MGRILLWVAAAVTTRRKVAFEDPATLSREESHSKIIQAGLRDLENIRVKHQIPARGDERMAIIASNREKTKNAIDLDIREFQRILNRKRKGNHEDIIIYDMQHQTRPPYIIPRNTLELTTHQNVVRYLMEKIKPVPEALDLWSRHHGRHQRTRDQFSWEYLPPDEHEVVGEMVLELILRPSSDHDRYIVILVLENNRDAPKIIEFPPSCDHILPSSQGSSSGSCGCPTVQEHLERLLMPPGNVVATEIKSQKDVAAMKLCSLKLRRNELLVHWNPSPPVAESTSIDIPETVATHSPS